MLKSDQLRPDDCKLCCCFFMRKTKVGKKFYYYFFIFINNQWKQRKLLKKVKYSLIFASGNKSILSYERCACLDNATPVTCVDRGRRSFASEVNLSKLLSEHISLSKRRRIRLIFWRLGKQLLIQYIIITFHWLCAFSSYLTCQGWPSENGEQLRQTDRQTHR